MRHTCLRLIVAIVLIFSIWLLPGCKQKENYNELDFQFVFPETWNVVNVARLDTDGDQENEWVLLYIFDSPENVQFVPVRCAVYDLAHREPKLPIIYPYHLQAPGWTYVGEGAGRTFVSLQDVITDIPVEEEADLARANEVIVTSTDGDGLVNRISIYHWRDNVPNELRTRTDPHEVLVIPRETEASGEWYQCLGMFEGTLKVDLGVDKVLVWDRVNDRSQLAKVSTYTPLKGSSSGYLNADHELIAPVSTCLDFSHGIPGNVSQTPYPEKVIMAFQKSYAGGLEGALDFLTPEAQDKWRPQDHPWIQQDPCVKQIRYGPYDLARSEIRSYSAAEEQSVTEAEKQRISADEARSTKQAPAQKIPITAQIETRIQYSSGQQTKQVELRWRLTQVDSAWKITHVEELE
jgi:hypothetical protein